MSGRIIPREDARAAIIGAQFPGDSDLVGTVARTGFIRTLGGVDVYLAIRARLPTVKRAQIDAAVVGRELVVVPAVRGCIYLVSDRDVDLCLSLAEHQTAARTAREYERAGIARDELVQLGVQVVKVLGRGPLTTDALRRALPAGAVRKMDLEIKQKLGLYSTLSPALRHLELERRIERVLDGGRLDSERYLWRATGHTRQRRPPDVAALHARLAELFFTAAPIARLTELAEWAGISQTDAEAAISALELKDVDIAGEDGPFLASKRWRDHVARGRDAVAFLPFEDNVPALHGGPALLVDASVHSMPVPVWGVRGRSVQLGQSKHMMLRSFVADGRIAGVWEYDPDRAEIVYAWFTPPTGVAQARLRDLAYGTASFIHGELGHAHAISLDTDDALRERVEFVRGLASEPPRSSGAAKPAPERAAKPATKRQPRGKPAPKQPKLAAKKKRR
jgi:hypothetical protein